MLGHMPRFSDVLKQVAAIPLHGLESDVV